jgi:hypothetical protein
MRRGRTDPLSLLAAAGALIAVGCCAGLPAIGATLVGLTAAAMIGIASGGLLAAAAVAGGMLAWRAHRRRRGCPTQPRGAPR